jgi:hypothetical protein
MSMVLQPAEAWPCSPQKHGFATRRSMVSSASGSMVSSAFGSMVCMVFAGKTAAVFACVGRHVLHAFVPSLACIVGISFVWAFSHFEKLPVLLPLFSGNEGTSRWDEGYTQIWVETSYSVHRLHEHSGWPNARPANPIQTSTGLVWCRPHQGQNPCPSPIAITNKHQQSSEQ